MQKSSDHYRDTIAALKKLAQAENLRPGEREAVATQLDEILEMIAKLEAGRVEIAAYGEINAGKSALLNALLGRKEFEVAATGGKTRDRAKADWTPTAKEFSANGTKLVLVDTPGLNEVDGATRRLVARETARYADLVLFVTDGDLNQDEFTAIKELHDLNKPIILVINKIDRLTPHELAEVEATIRARVTGIIAPSNIVLAAGQPLPETRIIVAPDGSERREERERKPEIEALQLKILDILDREGKSVVALNASLFASEIAERIAAEKVKYRAKEANTLIQKFMIGKATAVALNPMPVFDIFGVVAADATMIVMLGKIYDEAITTERANLLVKDIVGAWGITGFATLAMQLAGSLFKSVPLAGHVITAIPQALAAAWATYIVGNAASVYFRQGGWGPKGVKKIIKEIIKNTDRDSVLSPIKEKLAERLKARA